MLQQKYNTEESALTNYSYVDIADGTGYVIFYGTVIGDEVNGTSYKLTPNIVYSDLLQTTYATSWDLDFDVEFNTPRTMKGNLFCSFTITSGSNVSSSSAIIVRKWDGTTETELARSYSSYKAIAANSYTVFGADVPIDTLQQFKKGESLRITLQGISAGGSSSVFIDPANRSDAGAINPDTTQVAFHVPFILDL